MSSPLSSSSLSLPSLVACRNLVKPGELPNLVVAARDREAVRLALRGLLGNLPVVSGVAPAVTAAAAASGAGAEGGALTTVASAVGQWPNMCVNLFVPLLSPPPALTL